MVNAETTPSNPSNRLLICLMAVSLGFHLLLIYLGDGWRSEQTVYIEFALKDASPPAARAIPRPRIRNKTPDLRHAPDPSLRKHIASPARMDPVRRPEPDHEEVDALPNMPGALDIAGISVADWAGSFGSGKAAGMSGGITRQDYFEMVRFKIESRKKYPEPARVRHIEGRVTVGFVLTAEGRTQAVAVVKSSGQSILDQAAVAAVKDASPFPPPPPGLFKETLRMTIVIAFELT